MLQEHKCVLDSCRALEAEDFDITYLPVQTNGLVDMKVSIPFCPIHPVSANIHILYQGCLVQLHLPSNRFVDVNPCVFCFVVYSFFFSFVFFYNGVIRFSFTC